LLAIKEQKVAIAADATPPAGASRRGPALVGGS